MELNFLNYEIIEKDGESIYPSKGGKVFFDIFSNSLDLYDFDDIFVLKIKISDIKIIPSFVKKGKICFPVPDNNLLYSIGFDKKESISIHTWKYILRRIYQEDKPKNVSNYSKYIISNPKEYQIELFEFAKKKNSIIFLETGLGKTYIAILIIKDIFGEPIKCNIINKIHYQKRSKQKVIFLFKTISLLLQQTKVLKYNTNLKVYKIYGGDILLPYTKFRSNLEKYDIICATPESIYRYFTFGYLKKDDISLIVLDECHHTRGGDFYNRILKNFILCNESNIKIIGLTASPSLDNERTEERILENIKNLCKNMNCFVTCPSNIMKEYEERITKNEKDIEFIYLNEGSSNDGMMKKFIFSNIIYPLLKNHPKIKGLDHFMQYLFQINFLFSIYSEEEKLSEKQNGIFDLSDLDVLNIFNLSNSEKYIEALLLKKGENEKINFSRELKDIMRQLKDDIIIKEIIKYTKNINCIIKYLDSEIIYSYTKDIVSNINLIIKNSLNYYFDYIELEKSVEKLIEIEFKSSYLLALESFLQSDKILKNENKTIVFVNQRIIANMLCKKFNLIFNNFYTTYVVGCKNNSSFNFTEEELKANIKSFSDDIKCVILFATNVIEEGIDLPQCNNVINLTDIKTIKEFIQKSGRARKVDPPSSIYLCCYESKKEFSKLQIEQIKMGVKVMKDIIETNKITPLNQYETYIKGIHYYETNLGARIYKDYAQVMINEFTLKLFNDGYCFVKTIDKIEERIINKKKYYIPFLSLPNVLENSSFKIYDNKGIKFEKREEAQKYFEKYKEYYYLKAVKLLHINKYFDDNLNFYKNYDELFSIENSSTKIPSEPKIKLKHSGAVFDNDFVEIIAHKLELQPGYISIQNNFPVVISDSILTLTSFDLHIQSIQLLKLYFYNKHFMNEEILMNKPRIDFTYFTRVNISINQYTTIKVLKKHLSLINFFYTYILFFSTDAEVFFYYNIYYNKFEFSDIFLKDNIVRRDLKFIFENTLFDNKKHLKEFQEATMRYSDHIVKFSLVKENNGEWEFDYEYLNNTLECVKYDIRVYAEFLRDHVISCPNEKNKLLDKKYRNNKLCEIHDRSIRNEADVGKICRNLLNHSKSFIYYYSHTYDIHGSTKFKNTDKTYTEYFLEKYNVLTDDNHRQFKKCILLDYNQKIMRYKINLRCLGNVHMIYRPRNVLKNCQFLPNEILSRVEFANMDQIYLFTLFPIILQKIQSNLIYYYQSICLRNNIPTFNTFKTLDIKLVIQALNCKSTLETENYERLEFLGDSVLKLISSFEVFKLYPKGNRDLLFSKRKNIENNKNLYMCAIKEDNQLDKFLFSTPVTLKRMSIPGFTSDESLIFNISFNRSFSKSCAYKKVIVEKSESTDTINQIESQEFIEKLEEYVEQTPLDIEMEDLRENDNNIAVDTHIPYSEMEEVVKNKIEIIHPNSFRIIYNKALSDIVESLTGLIFMSSLRDQGFYDILFKPSLFLKDLGVISEVFNLKNCEKFWLDDLVNPKCKFDSESKRKRFSSILSNEYYTFSNPDLVYQAFTHPSYLTEESFEKNFPYVKKSYQRLSFLGEAFISFFVSYWVYKENKIANENLLHKLKICGINHHIISLIAIDLELDKKLLEHNSEISEDIYKYVREFRNTRDNSDEKYRIKDDSYEALLDENFIIILCELFQSYIGAIFLDSSSVEKTFYIIENIMIKYLIQNATIDTYKEHPKVIILEEFMKRRHYFKSIKENGSNRVQMKFEKNTIYRKLKMYKYQLIIDKYIIYEDFIYYNRSTIKSAQYKAKDIFVKICKEVDRREKLKCNEKYLLLENILNTLNISYEKYNN